MKIPEECFKTRTVHRNILELSGKPFESILSCGLMHKTGSLCVQRNIRFSYFGGLYVLSGTGTYTDHATGKTYDLHPGCFVQRMPGVKHDNVLTDDGSWLEFYFCFGKSYYETMLKTGLISDKPVIDVGESQEIFQELLSFMDKLEKAPDQDLACLLCDTQRLLCRILSRGGRRSELDMAQVSEVLRRNLKVGISLEEVADSLGLGYESFRKRFKKQTGLSLSQYLIHERINLSKTMLLDQNIPIKAVALELGYCDEYAFIKQFQKFTGYTPSAFIKKYMF